MQKREAKRERVPNYPIGMNSLRQEIKSVLPKPFKKFKKSKNN